MKLIRVASWILISGGTLLVSLSGNAADYQRKTPMQQGIEEKNKKSETAAVMPVYKPPLRGAPGGRVGGGTRAPGRAVFVLTVLAPDHTGLTVREQPSLYWFISSPTSSPVELTVMDPGAIKPILETRIPSPIQPGLHEIRLADHGVRLLPGVAYRWFVAVVPDPDRRSKDILSGGAIERVEPPEGFSAKLARSHKVELPFLYAEAGFWYDALTATSELIETTPNDQGLRRQRASLITQVGLPEIGE